MAAFVKSIGSFVPNRVLTNFDLEKMVETSDDWIVKRTGIKERRLADDLSCSDMAVRASLKALKNAHMSSSDIDVIICATISGDYSSMPSTASIVANKLGVVPISAFDISAACTGFIYLLQIAKSLVDSKTFKNVLVIGSEKMSSIIDYKDRSTCILFGDGAGAAVVSDSLNSSQSIIDVETFSDGYYKDLLFTPALKSEGGGYLNMKGNEIFKIAVKRLSQSARDMLNRNHIKIENIKHFIPHQANYRILKAVQENLEIKDEQIVITVDKYGNTSSASIPMAMDSLYDTGRLKKGDLIMLNAFGGGLTWGSALIRF